MQGEEERVRGRVRGEEESEETVPWWKRQERRERRERVTTGDMREGSTKQGEMEKKRGEKGGK